MESCCTRPRLWLLVCACVLMSRVIGMGAPANTGKADCPCIDPKLSRSVQALPVQSACRDQEKPVPVQIGGSTYCYPSDYGASTCQSHDNKREPVCADARGSPRPEAPEWCQAKWCYVDRRACALEVSETMFLTGHPNLTFSYATCNTSLNSLPSLWWHGNMFSKADLRVHMLDEAPFVYPNEKNGILVDFYDRVFEKAGARYKVYPLSNNASNISAWDACVRDVHMGHLDLCFGTFWETPLRHILVDFVAPFDVDNFYIVSMKQDPGLRLQFFSALAPFTNELWGLIAFTILAVGFVAMFVEWRYRGTPTSDFASFEKSENNDLCSPSKWSDIGFGLCWTSYLSCLGFWTQSSKYEPRSRGGRLLQVGYSMFLTFILCGYTANLASSLVVEREATAAWGDLPSLLSRGKKFCCHRSILDLIETRYPGSKKSGVGVSSTTEAFEKLRLRECAAVVNSHLDSQTSLSKAENCDMMEHGSSMLPAILLQPVNPQFSRSLSFWSKKLQHEGVLEELKKKYQVVDECKDDDTQQKHALSAKDYVGIFFLVYFILSLAILYECLKLWMGKGDKKGDGSPAQDMENAPDNSSAESDMDAPVHGASVKTLAHTQEVVREASTRFKSVIRRTVLSSDNLQSGEEEEEEDTKKQVKQPDAEKSEEVLNVVDLDNGDAGNDQQAVQDGAFPPLNAVMP